MGLQLALPAGWALNLETLRQHPADRLDALVQDKLDAKAEIRAVLDRLAEKYGVPTSDVIGALGWIEEGLGDLLYDVELGLKHEIEGQDPV